MVNSSCTVAYVWLYETKGHGKQLLYSGIYLVIWNKGPCQTALVQWHLSGYMKRRAVSNSSCTVASVWFYETKGRVKQLLYSGICLVLWNKGPCHTALVQWHMSGYIKQRAVSYSSCTVAYVWLYETKGCVKQLLYSGICLVIWNKGLCQTAFVQWHLSGYMKQRAVSYSSCTVAYVWLYETKGRVKQLLYSGICLVIWNKGPCQTAFVQWHLSGYMKQRAVSNSFCTVAYVWLYETKGRVKQLLYSGICLVIWNKGPCHTALVQWHMSGYMKQRAVSNSSCTVAYVWLYETKGRIKQLLYSGICLVIWNKGPCQTAFVQWHLSGYMKQRALVNSFCTVTYVCLYETKGHGEQLLYSDICLVIWNKGPTNSSCTVAYIWLYERKGHGKQLFYSGICLSHEGRGSYQSILCLSRGPDIYPFVTFAQADNSLFVALQVGHFSDYEFAHRTNLCSYFIKVYHHLLTKADNNTLMMSICFTITLLTLKYIIKYMRWLCAECSP